MPMHPSFYWRSLSDECGSRKSYVDRSFWRKADPWFFCVCRIETCRAGWEGDQCNERIDLCQNITCENAGVCRSFSSSYQCECLGESFSGQFCQIAATRIVHLQRFARSVCYITIIFLCSFAVLIVTVDVLDYFFGFEAIEKERQKLRGEKKKNQKCRRPTSHSQRRSWVKSKKMQRKSANVPRAELFSPMDRSTATGRRKTTIITELIDLNLTTRFKMIDQCSLVVREISQRYDDFTMFFTQSWNGKVWSTKPN